MRNKSISYGTYKKITQTWKNNKKLEDDIHGLENKMNQMEEDRILQTKKENLVD